MMLKNNTDVKTPFSIDDLRTSGKSYNLWFDLVFCVFFIPPILFLIPLGRLSSGFPSFALVVAIYTYALYGAYRIINIPRLLGQNRYWLLALSVTLIVAATYIVSMYPFSNFFDPLSDPRIDSFYEHQTIWLVFLIISGFVNGAQFFIEYVRQGQLQRELESQRDKAFVAMYRAQIDPHFLFNTLNTIYGLVVTKSDKAEEALMSFSALMKYVYVYSDKETVSLSEEIDYLNNYVSLQSMRCNAHTKVRFKVDVDDPSAQLPPMLLINFIENAFKYGVSSTKDTEIIITLGLHKGVLDLYTENQIFKDLDKVKDLDKNKDLKVKDFDKNKEKDIAKGQKQTKADAQRQSENSHLHSNNQTLAKRPTIGLHNTRERLGLIYAEKYRLDINDNGTTFKVNLQIQL